MSEPASLAGNLPKHEALNGLISIAHKAVRHPDRTVVAVVVLDVAKVTKNVDTGEEVPTFRVRTIEPIEESADRDVLRRLSSRAHQTRTGKAVLPLDLEDEVREMFSGSEDE